MDKERIALIINDLEVYFKKLGDMKIKSEKDLDDMKFYASSMLIFSIINRTLDLASEIVTSKNLGFPMEYKELFVFLKKDKIIDKDKEEKLKDLVILRNKISHRYGIIKNKDILEAIKKIEIVKDFIKDIIKEIKK